MSRRRLILRSIAIAMMAPTAGALVYGQDFPSKPIRILAGSVGGGNDFTARMIAPGITGSLGQPVIVDNRATAISSETVAKAPPDGHTLLVAGAGLWVIPILQKAAYNTVRDFSPVSLTDKTASVLAVHPSLPARSVKELIALAKAKPGALNYSSGVIGGASQLAMELFKSMAGVNIVHVPYKGTGPAILGVITGEVQITVANAGLVAPHVKTGKLRALAVTSAEPSALSPGLPTVAAAGLPGYESVSMTGIFAPAKTPDAIINRLNQEIVRVLNLSEVKERFLNAGAETVASSPEQFAVIINADMGRMDKLIKDAGIKLE